MNKSWNKPAITNASATRLWVVGAYAGLVSIALVWFTFAQPTTASIVGITIVLALIPLAWLPLEYALIALLVIRPLIDTYSTYSILTLNSLSLNMNAVLGLTVCMWGIARILYDKIAVRSIPGMLWLGMFIIIGILGLIDAVDRVAAISELLRIGSMIIMYILAWHLVKKNTHFVVWIMNGLMAAAALPIMVSTYQLVTFSGLTWGNLANRVYGTFGHPNVLGFFMVLVLLITFVKYITAPPRQRSLIAPWILVGGSLALLFTYTRGAWLGLIIGLIVLGLLKYRKQLTISLVAIGLVLVAWQGLNVLVMNIFNVNLESIPIISRVTTRSEEADSIDYRLDNFVDMAPRALEQPIAGHGLGSFVILRKQGDIGLFDDPEAHNDYLRLAVETGFLGLLLYILFYAAILRQAIINFAITKTNSWQKNYSLGLIAIVVAFLAMSVADNILQGTALMWALMMVLGGLLAIVKTRG